MAYKRGAKIRDERWGAVYEGWDSRLERPASLKLPREETSEVPEARTRLEFEARMLSHIQLNCVPTIVGLEQMEGEPLCLVLEPLRGTTLDDMIHGSANLWARLSTLREACLAVDRLHKQEVIHRDLRPYNLLRTKRGDIKLLDFGLAIPKSLARPTAMPPRLHPVVGSFDYLAPEQVRGTGVDARADVFSLGVTLFELLTNQKPFSDSDVTRSLRKLMRGQRPSLQGKEDTEAFEAVVTRSLQPSADDRFPSAAELAHALEPLIDQASRFEDTFVFDVARS